MVRMGLRAATRFLSRARPSWRWARGSPTWVKKIPEKSLKEANTTIPFSLLSSKNFETMTNRPNQWWLKYNPDTTNILARCRRRFFYPIRPGGATALLCANIDKQSIQLLGRWKSDAMLRYLHVHAMNANSRFAQSMLDN